MITYCKHNLNEIKNLLIKLSADDYQNKSLLLSGASIGQHTRHILEFYLCLLNGVNQQVICYDHRKRDLNLESDIDYTINTIDAIISKLDALDLSIPVELHACFDQKNTMQNIPSSVYRELSYCLEHSIHHQALIKVGLKELSIDHLIDECFGVAPTTIAYRNKA